MWRRKILFTSPPPVANPVAGHRPTHGSAHGLPAPGTVDVPLLRTDVIGDVPQVVAHTGIHGQGTGVIGMKLIGEAGLTKPEEREASIRFVIGLGSVDAERIDRAPNA